MWVYVLWLFLGIEELAVGVGVDVDVKLTIQVKNADHPNLLTCARIEGQISGLQRTESERLALEGGRQRCLSRVLEFPDPRSHG